MRRRAPWRTLVQVDEWNVGFVRRTVDALVRRDRWRLRDVRWLLRNDPLRYVADPFPERAPDGGLRIWAESYAYPAGRGTLVRLDDVDGGSAAATPATIVHPRPLGHVSYPTIVHAPDGARLGVLEMAETGRLDLFRVDSEGARWRFEAPLLDRPALDPTILRHEGRWWLFCTLRGRRADRDLYLFHADTIRGPWRPHPANPVKSDPRSARPAGDPFRVAGSLFRPAQDGTRTYGGAISIARITDLTTTSFAEEVVTVIEPDPEGAYPDGVHTLRLWDDGILVDGKRRVHAPLAAPVKAWARVRHAARSARLRRARRPMDDVDR